LLLCIVLICISASALPSPALRNDLHYERDVAPSNASSGLDWTKADLAPRKVTKQDVKQQAGQQVKDKAKEELEKAGKKAAIKVGEKVAVAIAGTVAAAAVPVVGEIVQVAKMVEQVVELIVGAIKAAVKADHEKEAKFTQDIVGQAFNKNNKWNYLAINEKIHQKVNMVGQKDKDWGFTERVISIHFGKMKYYFYHFGNGTVENDGDGGYINWAFIGNFQRIDKKTGKPDPEHGMLVKFTKPT